MEIVVDSGSTSTACPPLLGGDFVINESQKRQ